MTTHAVDALNELPAGWRSLWRAHVALPEAVHRDEFTVFVRAVGRDAAHVAIERALGSMFPDVAAADLDDAYYNVTSARELLKDGVSERHADRLFETAWRGEQVMGWVRKPVFIVPDAADLFASWCAATKTTAVDAQGRA